MLLSQRRHCWANRSTSLRPYFTALLVIVATLLIFLGSWALTRTPPPGEDAASPPVRSAHARSECALVLKAPPMPPNGTASTVVFPWPLRQTVAQRRYEGLQGHLPSVPTWILTSAEDSATIGSGGRSPFSPSGRFVALLKFPDGAEGRPVGVRAARGAAPLPPAEVVVIDLFNGRERAVAITRGWDTRSGAMVQWGQSDQEVGGGKRWWGEPTAAPFRTAQRSPKACCLFPRAVPPLSQSSSFAAASSSFFSRPASSFSPSCLSPHPPPCAGGAWVSRPLALPPGPAASAFLQRHRHRQPLSAPWRRRRHCATGGHRGGPRGQTLRGRAARRGGEAQPHQRDPDPPWVPRGARLVPGTCPHSSELLPCSRCRAPPRLRPPCSWSQPCHG